MDWMGGVAHTGWYATFMCLLVTALIIGAYMLGYEVGKERGAIQERRGIADRMRRQRVSGR